MHSTPSSMSTKRAAPVVLSLLSDVGTPVSVFHSLSRTEPTAFLFESTEGDSRLARYSFIGVDPIKTITFKDGKASILHTSTGQVDKFAVSNPLKFLQEFLREEGYHTPDGTTDYPFTGGLVGYLGYAATASFEGIPQQTADPFNVPDCYHGLYDAVIAFDHQY